MNRGRFAGSWRGSGQVGPFSARSYTRAELAWLVEEHTAALNRFGAGHRVTEAYRESLERAVTSYHATHRRPWRKRT